MEIIAHRGSQELMPENTLEAYKNAVELGCNAIDADIVISKDKVVMVYHDLFLNPERTKNERGQFIRRCIPIRDLTVRQLKELTVGECKSSKKYPHLKQIAKSKIPTLEELFVFLNLSENKHVAVNLEFKTSPHFPGLTHSQHEFAQAVIVLINKYSMQERVFFQSFDWNILSYLQTRTKNIPILAISSLKSYTFDLLTLRALFQGTIVPFSKVAQCIAHMLSRPRWPDMFAMYTGNDAMVKGDNATNIITKEVAKLYGDRGVWSPDFNDLSKDNVKIAHKNGLKVFSWTLKTEKQTLDAINWGVDAIFHDRIDIGFDVMKAHAQKSR